MKEDNRKKKVFVVLAILLFLSIGYAALSATLNINGTTGIKGNTWDVHFENVQVKEGSVESDKPQLVDNKTKATFDVTFTKPGDFYEFTVDAVNKGTIDAMVESVTNTELEESVKKYVDLSITYEDGREIKKDDLLVAETGKSPIKVSIKYKKDIKSEDLPNENKDISVTLEVEYTQAKELTKSNLDEEKIEEGYVAKIGSNYYKTLTSAIDTINDTTPTTIKFLTNIEESVEFPVNRDITIDLNKNNFSTNSTVNGKFTITGDGTIKPLNPTYIFAFSNDSITTFENGNFSTNSFPLFLLNDAVLTINNGEYTHQSYAPIFYSGSQEYVGKIYVNGGVFSSTSQTFDHIKYVEINDGNFTVGSASPVVNGEDITINGGKLNNFISGNVFTYKGNININGGEIISKIRTIQYAENLNITGGLIKSNKEITGSIKNTKISGGTIIARNEDASQTGLFDVFGGKTIEISGGTITNESKKYSTIYVDSGGELNISGGTIIAHSVDSPTIYVKEGAKFNMSSGKIKNIEEFELIQSLILVDYSATFELTGGTLETKTNQYALLTNFSSPYYYYSSNVNIIGMTNSGFQVRN